MKVIFSGGGTLGPVTPLLAIKEIIAEAYPDAKFLWVGTMTGPEKELVEKQGIRFISLSSGKFRRYFSVLNVWDVFRLIRGFFQSLHLVWKETPDICISAGGFISVPLHYAAAVLATPTWIHQQDIKAGLANRLMSPFASIITVATKEQWKDFSYKKTYWMGNPIRRDLFEGNKETAKKIFDIKTNLPIVFATGGGTGSMKVNQMVVEALPHLEGVCEVIHLSGKERPHELTQRAAKHLDFYHTYEFFTSEMKHAYAAADVVISRGGFGTLTELAALKKATILIPKPGHQEENVSFLNTGKATVMLNENNDNGLILAGKIKELLKNESARKAFGKNLYDLLPPAGADRVLQLFHKAIHT